MKKKTLFLLTAVVAVSTVFLMGCPTDVPDDPPPATYSKYKSHTFANEAAYNTAKANPSAVDTSSWTANEIGSVKTFAEEVAGYGAADIYTSEPFIFAKTHTDIPVSMDVFSARFYYN